jgi:hypothetical protein
MKSILFFITVIAACFGCNAKKDSTTTKNETAKTGLAPADIQIRSALLAAPKEKRDSCSVM